MKRLMVILAALLSLAPALHAQEVGELPLPTVPDMLRTPAERAAYLVEHFWDAMAWDDPSRARSESFIEQNLVNYLSLFPFVDSATLSAAVGGLMRAAEVDKEAYLLLADTAEKYLDESDSPMRNEEHYIPFLEAQTESAILDRYEKMRPQYRLSAALKNRRGALAADFEYSLADGTRSSLARTERGSRLLLFFYDPECDHCREVAAMLSADGVATSAVADGRLTVLAVSPDAPRDKWLSSLAWLPQEWLRAFDESGIRRRGLYDLRDLPALYLLDGEGRVMLKEPRPEELVEALGK